MTAPNSKTLRPRATRAMGATRAGGLICLALLGALSLAAQATCPSVTTATRFTYSSDGTQVTDKKTGLVWARCSVGQNWSSNTCNGTATTYNHEGALSYAQAQSGWRLPNVKELRSLVDEGCSSPAIDSTAFPNTASNYWSSTPNAYGPGQAFVVDFSNGDSVGGYRRESTIYAIRLVRFSQ